MCSELLMCILFCLQAGDLTTSANVEDENEGRNESTAEKIQNMEVILRKSDLVFKTMNRF